jgi:hypothetical protein
MHIYGKLINCKGSDYFYLHDVVHNSTDSNYIDLHVGLCESKNCKFHLYSFICFFQGTNPHSIQKLYSKILFHPTHVISVLLNVKHVA